VAQNLIKTYDPDAFLNKFTSPGISLNDILPFDFGNFFVVKVEEMFRFMKLPIPPTKATIHTLIFITEGQATMNIGSQSYTIEKNNCFIVPSGQVFSFGTPDVNKGFICSFHDDFVVGKFFKNDLLRDFEFLKIWGNPVLELTPTASGYVLNLFHRLLNEYNETGLTRSDILHPYLITLLSELNRAYQPLTDPRKNSALRITNKFRELISGQIKTVHQVSEYASALHVTPNHLNKSVRNVTGKSAMQWIMDAIVLEAKVLLYQTNLAVSEIALELGISDQSYFSRLFKKQEGVTPLEFRKKIEKS
jgi:AraC family transcriptional activator of pobA